MRKVIAIVLLVALTAAVVFTATAYAKKPGGDGPCHPDILCPMVWDPVLCDDGKVYSNDCVAFVWCQTNCEPLGGGPVPLFEE